MEGLREEIDCIDEELLNIIGKRIRIVEEIGKYKKANGLPSLDEERWREVLRSKIVRAQSLGISENFVEKIYNLIHEHSLEIEKEI